MVDDITEQTSPSPDAARARREPPTIDLEASEVKTELRDAGEAAQPGQSSPDPAVTTCEPPTIDLEASEVAAEEEDPGDAAQPEQPPPPRPPRFGVFTAVIAAITGAAAAALVIAAATLAGWPEPPPTAPAPPPANSAAIDELTTRVAGIEAKISQPVTSSPAPAADPALASRVEELEKSVAALRGQLDGLHTQSEQLAAAVNEVKSAPRETPPSPDVTGINERIAGIEQALHAQTTEIARQGAEQNTKPADDTPLRRVVAATLLDVLVRTGDPFPAALEAAKSLAADPDMLKPLEGFASSGVPSAASLSRELLTLVPKLSPPAPPSSSTGSGIVERLEAGAAKLVRIERTDTAGNGRDSVIARVTAAALHNDFKEARRELNTLAPADRAAAQGWIEKADARDAALTASRQFAAEAMTALAKPAQ
jgi:hypothetical protein